jgi:hypothetical protein
LNLFRGEGGGGESLAHSRAGGIVKKCEKNAREQAILNQMTLGWNFLTKKLPSGSFSSESFSVQNSKPSNPQGRHMNMSCSTKNFVSPALTSRVNSTPEFVLHF